MSRETKPAAKRPGRPQLEAGVPTIPVTVRMTAPQKEKLARLGGSEWVRGKIDRAKEPLRDRTDDA